MANHAVPLFAAAWLMVATLAAAAPQSTSGANESPEIWPQAPPTTVSPTVDAFVAEILAHMSLEEKIGQMIQADIASITPAELKIYKLGSILAGGNAAPDSDVRTPPQAWLDMTDAFYRASLDKGDSAHAPIPILFGIDAVHGHAKVLGATIFPHNVGLGAAHDPDLIRRIGQATAEEVASTGIDWTFAPTIAVARDPRWGRSYESYSESPELVAEYAPAMVTGLQGEFGSPQFMAPGHTLSSIKHFVGDGGTLHGRDQGDTIVPEAVLADVHGAGYPAALKAGAMIVMASYNSWNGIKLHGNHYLLTDILKGRLGFDGFVVGDWNAHEQVPGCTKSDCPASILAGVDMLMAPDSWKELYRHTLAEAQAGVIPASRIDEAVRRILRVKTIAGIFDRPAPKQRPDAGDFRQLGSAAHRAIAREAVRKSLVLLKNAHATLPIDPRATILVAGDAADDIGAQSGGWTLDWQGAHNKNSDFPGGTSIYGGIRAAVTAAGGTATLSPSGRFAKKPDAAIVVFGERPYAEFEGDRETLQFSPEDRHELQLLRRLRAQGVPTVSVFLSGRPLWVNPELNASDAFVAAWWPGSEGEGIADVLFRAPAGGTAYDFTGRLSFSWPKTAMPVSFDSSGNVSGALFPRGAGLDYRSPAELPELTEDPQVPPTWRSPAGSLFHAGHAIAPWSVFAADGGDQVHVTTAKQSSPHGALGVELEPDGATVTWSGSQRGALIISGRASDFSAQARHGAEISMRYRIDQAPEQNVALGVLCTEPKCGTVAGALLDMTQVFKSAPIGVWQSINLPLSCLTAAGARLNEVEAPFALATAGPFAATIADIRITTASRASGRCP
jgi:beta-glucosidase